MGKRYLILTGILFYMFLVIDLSFAEKIDWVKTFGGIKNESIDHIVVCPNNDIIVIGTFSDSLFFRSGSENKDTLICENEYEDIFIVKFKSHGAFEWAASFAHGKEYYDWWLFPSVDSQGNLFIGGTFIGDVIIGKNDPNETVFESPLSNSLDIFLVKISGDGLVNWALKMGDNHQERIWDIASDKDGFVYIAGEFWGSSAFFPGGNNADIILTGIEDRGNAFSVKYDKDGNIQWANKITNNEGLLIYSIAVSISGNVAVAGYFKDTMVLSGPSGNKMLSAMGETDIFVATYDSSGNFLWAVDEGGALYDMASDLEFDSEGNVIVAGFFTGMLVVDSTDTLYNDDSLFEEHDDIIIIKYDKNGNYIWSDAAGGPYPDRAEKIQIFKNDHILLSGFYWFEATFIRGNNNSKIISNIADTSSHFAARYRPDGNLYWVADVDSSFNTFNTNMAIDSAGDVIRAGEYLGNIDLLSEENSITLNSQGGSDIYLAKFTNNITSISKETDLPNEFRLDQNYPNPFNLGTSISFHLGHPQYVEIAVYNNLGQHIKTLFKGIKGSGNNTVIWDGKDHNNTVMASGIYFYSLKTEYSQKVRKMLLIK